MPTDKINSRVEKRTTPAGGAADSVSKSQGAVTVPAGLLGRIAMLSADLEGKINGCNEPALNILGRAAIEVVGQPLAAFFMHDQKAEQHELHRTIVARSLKDGHYRSALQCRTASGKLIGAELSVNLVRNGSSSPIGLIALFG